MCKGCEVNSELADKATASGVQKCRTMRRQLVTPESRASTGLLPIDGTGFACPASAHPCDLFAESFLVVYAGPDSS